MRTYFISSDCSVTELMHLPWLLHASQDTFWLVFLVLMVFLTLANNVFLELEVSSSENYKCGCSYPIFVSRCYVSISSLVSITVEWVILAMNVQVFVNAWGE